jgi:hypothetical protein
MQPTASRLLSRTATLLRAKERLVFYAIALYALDVGAPFLTSWFADHKPLAALLQNDNSPLWDVIAHPGVVVVLVSLIYFAAVAWFRAGYIRSIIGARHFGARDGAQFGALFLLMMALAGLGDAFGYAIARAGDGVNAVTVLLPLAALGLTMVLQYTDYVIVISGGGPLAAARRSLATVRANLAISVLILIAIQLIVSFVLTTTADAASGPWRQVLPLVVIRLVSVGSVSFVADVALVSVYIDSIERGALPAGRQ